MQLGVHACVFCDSLPIRKRKRGARIFTLCTQNCGFSSHLGSCNGQYGTPKRDPLTLAPYLSRNFFALRAA